MALGLGLLGFFSLFVWVVFFKFKWLEFSITWGIVSFYVLLHLFLIFVIGLRFMTPYSHDARVVQHTIQLVPRLTEPTMVTAVLVEQNVPVKKGTPLFEFDKTIYAAKVAQLEAQLAAAKQNVLVMAADVQVSTENVAKAEAELTYAKYQQKLSTGLANQKAGPQEEAQKSIAQLEVAHASVKQANAELERAKLKYDSNIDGVNTTVAQVQAELEAARFFLNNTTLVAPEDGMMVNVQVRPGTIAGDVRVGAIASFICSADRYILCPLSQETIKYIKVGPADRDHARHVSGADFPGQGRGDLEGQRRRAVHAQRIPAEICPAATGHAPGALRGEGQLRCEGPDDFPDRRAGWGGGLHHGRRVGGAAQDFHSHAFVGQLAVSASVLMKPGERDRGDANKIGRRRGAVRWRRVPSRSDSPAACWRDRPRSLKRWDRRCPPEPPCAGNGLRRPIASP